MAALAAFLLTPSARAANQTWTGSGADGNWSTLLNWNGAVPGSTAVTNNADTATFNAAIANTWGNAVGNPVVIDSATQNIGGISFTQAAGNYFLGSTVGNSLKLSSGGTIQILSGLTSTNAVETVNAPLSLYGSYTLANNSANGTGAGAGTLNFGGPISGGATGNDILTLSGSNTNANTISGAISNGAATSLGITKSGAGTWTLSAANTYTGATTVNAGTLKMNAFSNTYAGTSLTVGSSGTFYSTASSLYFSGIFAAAGAVFTGNGQVQSFFINYNGTDPTAGVVGTIGLYQGLGEVAVIGMGTGNMTFGRLGADVGGGNSAAINTGTGTMTVGAITNYTGGGSASVRNPFGTIKLTGTSGKINGVTGGIQSFLEGTLVVAPGGSGANVVVQGQTTSYNHGVGNGNLAYAGAGTFRLDKGANLSVAYQTGDALGTSATSAQILIRQLMGTLTFDPVNGASTLGTSAKFQIFNGTGGANDLPQLTNGIASASMVVVDSDGTRKADFVTYNGTGITSDVGYQQATYNLTDTFATSGNLTVVKNTVAQTISADTSAFALRNDGAITINSGVSLILGNAGPVRGGGGGVNSTATTSPTTGLILNGGSIIGSGTLAVGAGELAVYTSSAGGTIGAKITGTGANNNGMAGYWGGGYDWVGLNKFGPGTLSLTNTANTNSGVIVISQGALDVGAISSANTLAGMNSNLTFNDGVIQGNGTFTRSLVLNNNQVTWNGIHNTNPRMSGGFAARGGDLTVAIGGTGAPTALVWGTTTDFLNSGTDGTGGVLIFGSDTSTGQVDFKNAIDLGSVANNPFYRTIMVNQGTGADSAKISGVITSTVNHGLIKDGAGKLILAGTNTYTGDTVVSKGTLVIGGNQTGATGALTVNSGATLQLGEGSTAGQLAAASAIVNNGTFSVKRSNAAVQGTDFSAAAITGSGAFTQAGTGTTTLNASNSYTGLTTVTAGTLILSGGGVIGNGGVSVNGGEFKVNGTTTSAVNVATGATVSGSGTVGNLAIASGGTLSPGNSPGIINTGNFTLAIGANLSMEINGTSAPVAGSNYDQANVNGSVSLGGNLTLTLSGSAPTNGNLYFLINNDGADAIGSSFANVNGGSTSHTTEFTLGGQRWFISYAADFTGGTFTGGNDVALYAIPEPATWALLAFSLTTVMVLRHRRRTS